MACLSLLRSLSPDFSLTVVPGANKLDIQILHIQRVVFDKLCRASTSSPVSLLKIVDGEVKQCLWVRTARCLLARPSAEVSRTVPRHGKTLAVSSEQPTTKR